MNKSQILSKLADNPKIKKIALNIAGNKYADDLYQHLFLTLCELPAAKIQDAHKKKYLEFLSIKIMQNSYKSYSSPFSDLFQQFEPTETINLNDKNIVEDLGNIEELIDREHKLQPIINYLNQPISQENFFRVTLITMWAKGESYRKISAKTKIPLKSIAVAIQTALKEIKEQCDNYKVTYEPLFEFEVIHEQNDFTS